MAVAIHLDRSLSMTHSVATREKRVTTTRRMFSGGAQTLTGGCVDSVGRWPTTPQACPHLARPSAKLKAHSLCAAHWAVMVPSRDRPWPAFAVVVWTTIVKRDTTLTCGGLAQCPPRTRCHRMPRRPPWCCRAWRVKLSGTACAGSSQSHQAPGR